jgi:hypothetical protein
MAYDSCINAARKPGGEYVGGLRGYSAVNVVNPCTVTFSDSETKRPACGAERSARDTFVFVPL